MGTAWFTRPGAFDSVQRQVSFVDDLEHHTVHQHLVMSAERQNGTDAL